jgi:hypothetical protein
LETLLLPLIPLLQSHFEWNLARTKCIASLIVALIKVRTVNLVQLAIAMSGNAKKESKYRRLQRLFEQFQINFSFVALFIAQQLPDERYILTMDRTNWQFGQTSINILFLCVVHRGIAVPILWTVLDKKKKGGNSNTAERIALMERFIELFGVEKIESYLADREFIGRAWIAYLLEKKIKIRIRIKANIRISRSRTGSAPARNFFRHLRCGEYFQLAGKRIVFGHSLYVSGARLSGREYLIIISAEAASCEQILGDYKKRWEIETLFKALKSQGFDFEATHLTDPERLNKLTAFLALAFLWAHLMGEWLHEQKPIRLKSHQRRAISIFRYGLDHLREILLNITEKLSEFFIAIALFYRVNVAHKQLI